MQALALVNGVLSALADAKIPADDPGFLSGWTVFETLVVRDGVAPGAELHLERLAQSAVLACVPLGDAGVLAAELAQLVALSRGECRLRVTLSVSGLRVLSVQENPAGRRNMAVVAVRGPAVVEPFLGGAVKHGSRAPWMVAVRRAGVDEVLLVDGDGRFTEGTTSGVLAVVGGVLYTAPADGRILESTTVRDVVARAERLGVPVERQGALASGPWDGLYIASSTRDLCPVVRLDGVDLPGWDPVGRALAEAG